jgi:hypothetical protein
MEAIKYITTISFEIKDGNNKKYIQKLFEKRDIPITQEQWLWLYENIMHDDSGCAYENGIYETDDSFFSLDCQKVLEQMNKYLDELQTDYNECLQDKKQDFQKTFKEIKELLEQNIEFTIYYE